VFLLRGLGDRLDEAVGWRWASNLGPQKEGSLEIRVFQGYLAAVTGHFCKIDWKGTMSYKKGICGCEGGG
jgi:hypothetical protein